MRTVLNVVLILCVAVALGFAVRTYQRSVADSSGGEASAPRGTLADLDLGDAQEVSEEDLEQLTAFPPRGEPVEGLVTEFTLIERSGETVRSSELIGQPHVVSFFFTTCPSICVIQNQKMQQLQREFAGEDVRLLSISVDPETDTPERLREYAERFKADEDQWLFLTGEPLHIRRVGAEMYFQLAEKQAHSERFVLVDREGNPQGQYRWSDERQFEKLKRDLRAMLEQGKDAA